MPRRYSPSSRSSRAIERLELRQLLTNVSGTVALNAKRMVSAGGATFAPVEFNRFHVGDFNGDGRDEIAARKLTDSSLWVALTNPGLPLTTSLQNWGQWNTSLNWVAETVGDFNGDGRSDLAGIDLGASQTWVSLGGNTAFASPTSYDLIPAGTNPLTGNLLVRRGNVI